MTTENELNTATAEPKPEAVGGGSNRWLAYERLQRDIWKQIMVRPGESVMVRHAFRWHRNGEVVSNAYESFSLEGVCEDRGWKIVERFGEHIAVISEANQ
jgi:hypothetical protein